jgi:uncharacterized protein YggE
LPNLSVLTVILHLMPTEITVRGSSAWSQAPERGIVHASIGYEGPSMEPVYNRVAHDLDVVHESMAELREGNDAAVTWWSAERLRTWTTRPWNQDGKQLPLVHHASVNIQVKFRDFAALSSWVSQRIADIEGFQVSNISWALTARRREELIREVREQAVHDAIRRAQLYAGAVGLGGITPVAIADAGMLDGNLRPDHGQGQEYTMARTATGRSGGAYSVELVPQDVEVSAAVDARFVADGSERASYPSAGTDVLREANSEAGRDVDTESDVGEFRDDDEGYLRWLADHPGGYVVNVLRSYSKNTARLHRASCWAISGQSAKGVALTYQYVKVCAELLAELDRWAIDQVGEVIVRCGTCRPDDVPEDDTSFETTGKTVAVTPSEIRHDIRGPVGNSVVEAWADDYIRFENLPAWQHDLRNEIRSRCRQLEPATDQVLHASFHGAKHPKADVENVLLYYIGSFREAGRNGIRFEHGSGALDAPDGTKNQYEYGYRYALAPRSETFAHWRVERTLASFDWIDLGDLRSEKLLAQVWLQICRGQVEVFDRLSPDAPFAVRVEVHPPSSHQPVWGGMVKGVFDGVVSAFQAHTDSSVLSTVAARLAAVLPADSVEIEEHLLDQRRAVLGAVQRLVSPYGESVKWDPSDHLCVAGELLASDSPPLGDSGRWAIRGGLVEVGRA